MSRIGKEPVVIPKDIRINIKKNKVVVTGTKGTLEHTLNEGISAKISNNTVIVSRISDEKKYKSLHGLNRSLINNMVVGLSKGYLKKLMIVGTGYKAEIKGKWLVLSLGFSHDIYFEIPEEIDVRIEKIGRAEASIVPGLQVVIDLSSHDKMLLGSVAAAIRSIRPPEPYKGKGIRYADEHIRKKAGKIAGGATG